MASHFPCYKELSEGLVYHCGFNAAKVICTLILGSLVEAYSPCLCVCLLCSLVSYLGHRKESTAILSCQGG